MKKPIELDEDVLARIDRNYPDHAYMSCNEGVSNAGFNRCPRCTSLELAMFDKVNDQLTVVENEAEQVKAELLKIVGELRRALLFYKNYTDKELGVRTPQAMKCLQDARFVSTGATRTHVVFKATKKVAVDAIAKLDKHFKGIKNGKQ